MGTPEVRFRRATTKDAAELALTMRERDVDEVRAALGCGPFDGVTYSMRRSAFSFAMALDGKVAAVWGVEPVAPWGSLLSGSAALVWVLTSTEVDRHKRAYLKASSTVVDTLLEAYPALVNWVDARYEAALRWAKWLGFSVGEARPYGAEQRPFHPITIRRTTWA